ncbi:uncharacterized protein LOC105283118 isoform X4 [Ooceraea biroi]|uniref:uncharacterized protein LOC105283118 isoform X4 n=1 Tax=Ooceraea biroi TaxID=2015173 RepID=UPI0005BA55F8|nr:uncharacterized protein LOC105283118 isoform X4 [Ooceraea biroi]
MDEPAFVVLKFSQEDNNSDEEEINYEVGLTKWLTDIDDEQMKGFTYWPPSDQDAGNFVRKEKPVECSWPKYAIEVLRYYNLYIKARAAVRGFVAEDSAYETEKETGRGKRKRMRNRMFENTDSDEENTRCNKKSIPAPPSVPFKCSESRKNVIQKTGHELNNHPLPSTSFPLTKSYVQACSKSNVERLKKRQETNNNTNNVNINNASVSDAFTAHENKYSRNKKLFHKNKVQSLIKDTLSETTENTFSQSSASSLTFDEGNKIHDKQNETK